jgi:type I phosphodiesterase/nucleotide pyrophosphatase
MTMSTSKKDKLILLEFNELCPSLIEKWMLADDLPNFKAFYDASQIYLSQSDEPEAPFLEPWIQWYSLHTGLNYRQHKVFRLTDGPLAGHKDIWSTLQENGLQVGNFSSMNAAAIQNCSGFYVPDPWCTGQNSHPNNLQKFQDFVQSQVQEYTNTSNQDTIWNQIAIGTNLIKLGVTPKTIGKIVSQLKAEKFGGANIGWKRAFILDWLYYDVFKKLFHEKQPNFSTFFLNSTAHMQHAYWRHMDPSAFSTKPNKKELSDFGNAIKQAYINMDKLLGRFIKLSDDNGATLALATGLSQKPFTSADDIGGQRFYRFKSIERFLDEANVPYNSVEPVMTHQYMVRFESSERRDTARKKLSGVTIANEPVLQVDNEGASALYIGNSIHENIGQETVVSSNFDNPSSSNFYDIFYQIEGIKSGCHDPVGLFWIRNGEHKVHQDACSILDVAPSIFNWFDISEDKWRSEEMEGRVISF